MLIIDSSKESTESLSRFFNSKGINPMSTNDAMEGLLNIRKENFDVVLLDIDMPIINGLGIIEFLAREDILKNQNIFIVSKYDIPKVKLQYLLEKDGIQGVLDKTMTNDDLLNSIQSCITKSFEKKSIKSPI